MKKVLFATTALVASAGVAAADVALSGFAEIGIFGGENIDTQFHTDIDVTFTMTGTADNGLSFGANVDLDEGGSGAAAHANDADDGGASFFIANGPWRLDMGDTDGAFDAALTEVAIGSSIRDDHTIHAGYNGNSAHDGIGGGDGQIARFSYTFDAFTGHLSIEQTGNGDDTADDIFGLGVAYNADLAGLALGVGLGYQTGPGGDFMGISLNTTLASGLQAIINYTSADDFAGWDSHMAIGLGYSMNALTIGVNYGQFEGGASDENSGFGLAANYDLGGGLSAQLGYGSSDTPAGDSNTFSLGMAMSF